MSQLPRLIKNTIVPIDYTTRREVIYTITPNSHALAQILDFINSIKTKGQPDTVILHRDSGGHIMKVEWRTVEKTPI